MEPKYFTHMNAECMTVLTDIFCHLSNYGLTVTRYTNFMQQVVDVEPPKPEVEKYQVYAKLYRDIIRNALADYDYNIPHPNVFVVCFDQGAFEFHFEYFSLSMKMTFYTLAEIKGEPAVHCADETKQVLTPGLVESIQLSAIFDALRIVGISANENYIYDKEQTLEYTFDYHGSKQDALIKAINEAFRNILNCKSYKVGSISDDRVRVNYGSDSGNFVFEFTPDGCLYLEYLPHD